MAVDFPRGYALLLIGSTRHAHARACPRHSISHPRSLAAPSRRYREKNGGAVATEPANAVPKKKAGVCFSFQKGECSRGDACIFSHGEAEATEPANAAPKKKAGVCFSFQKGECSRGDACIFSH